MYLCRILAEEKLQAIAERFNKRDHTTVIAARFRPRGRAV
jgi:chromosomal replication initiator protein